MDTLKTVTVDSASALVLKRPSAADKGAIKACLMDEELMQQQGGARSESEANEFLDFIFDHWSRFNLGHFLILVADQVAGMASLKHLDMSPESSLDVGIMLYPKFRGSGFADKIVKHLANIAINELGETRLAASTLEGNEEGARLLEQLGFEKTSTSDINYAGRTYKNVLCWNLKKKEERLS